MKIISKIFISAALLAAVMWFADSGRGVVPSVQSGTQAVQVQPAPLQPAPLQPVPAQTDSMQQAMVQAPLERLKHVLVAAVHKRIGKPVVPEPKKDIAIVMVPVDKLLQASSGGAQAKLAASHNALDKATQETEEGAAVGLDVGKGLPLPMPESVLITPADKPDGFHVGVDYHVDQKWDLTGLAGVTTNGGTVISPAKPTFNQVGVRASYRF